jgi:hypothetical protein
MILTEWPEKNLFQCHGLAWDQMLAFTIRGQQLTTFAMAQPVYGKINII